MGDLPDWPKSLEAWEPELRFFARDLLGHIAPVSERLLQALGPLRVAAEQRSDEPNGYAALARRGPYERLLASEWAMQLEDPDEFIRRASNGEHLFVELERRSPAATLEAWLLLDTGPSQLGSPRIGQLAALVAFARRARTAKVKLRWAPLWNWEQPEHEGLSPPSIRAWIDSRTPWEPTTGVLSQWSSRWPENKDEKVQRDVWIIGSPSIIPLAEQHGFGAVTLDDTRDGASLEVQVQPPRRRRTHALKLPLPDSQQRVKLLRDPFDWSRPKPPPRPKPESSRAIPLEPGTELVFSHDSHRLLARTADGSVVAIPIRNTPRAGYGWPTLAVLPPYTKLIACSWSSRRQRELIVAGEKARWRADWDGRLLMRLDDRSFGNVDHPRAEDLFIGTNTPVRGWVRRGLWWAPSSPASDASRRTQIAASAALAFMIGVRVGDQKGFEDLGVERWITVDSFPHRAWVGSNWNGLVAACIDDQKLEVHVATPPSKELRSRAVPRALLTNDEPWAVSMSGEGPVVFSITADKRSIRSLPIERVAPQWMEEVRARAPIEAMALSPSTELLAWRDLNGELGIYSRKRRETVLRLHIKDVSREVT